MRCEMASGSCTMPIIPSTMPNTKSTKRKATSEPTDIRAVAKRPPSVAGSGVSQAHLNVGQVANVPALSRSVAMTGSQGVAMVPQKQMFSLVSGMPNRTQNLSHPPTLVEVGHSMTSVSDATGDEQNHPCKAWLEMCQLNGRMDNEAIMKKDLMEYVRYELFPKLKFFMGKTQLTYSPEPKSICGLICTKMGLIQPKAAVSWWERYKDMIADVLNAKRADVTGAIKREFMSKFRFV
jgi:hypothetical protein